MFNTSDAVPRSEGRYNAVNKVAAKLRARPIRTIGKQRAPAQGETRFALPDELHTAYAPYSPYVTTPYGRALKAATTKGKPRRIYSKEYKTTYKEVPITHGAGTGKIRLVESGEKPRGTPVFRDIVQHPTLKDPRGRPVTKIAYGYSNAMSKVGTKKKVGGVMAEIVGKYPAYSTAKGARFRPAAYLKARFGIESERIRGEMFGKGPSESDIKAAQRSAHKDILGNYRKQVQEEAGGERLSVKETRDRMKDLINREIQGHRDYRAGELRESRAIIHARGVPLRTARAENEKISEYVGRLGEMAKARKEGVAGIRTRALGRVQKILESGVKKIDPQLTPNVLPEEISRRAGQLKEGLTQKVEHGGLSEIQKTEIAKHLQGGLTKPRKPVTPERVEKLYGKMERLRDLGATPGGETTIREGIVRSKKLFRGLPPTIASTEKGYPFLRKAGIGLGTAGAVIGGAYLAKKLLYPSRKKQQFASRIKEIRFAELPPEAQRLLDKAAKRLWEESQRAGQSAPAAVSSIIRSPRIKRQRVLTRYRNLVRKQAIEKIMSRPDLPSHPNAPSWKSIAEENESKVAQATKHEGIIKAESDRMIEAEKTARKPIIEAESQKRYERGYNLGKMEEAERGKSYREEQVAKAKQTLGEQHAKSTGRLKWAGAGLIGGAGVGGYMIGRGKRQRDHEFSAWSNLKPKDQTEPEPGPAHDIATGAVEGGLGFLATDRLLKKFGPRNLGPLGKFGVAAGLGGLSTGVVGYGLNRLIRKKITQHKQQQQANMSSRLRLIQFERKRQQPRSNQRTLVARDRYIKQIKQQDIDTANRHYIHTALLGGAIGALSRKAPTGLPKAILTGAGAGIGAQALTRAYTARTKDPFGERSWEGKREEKAPELIGAGALGVMALRKLRRTALSDIRKPIYFEQDQDKPDWLAKAAHNALYKKTYSSTGHAQKVKKWFGRTHRIARDIRESRQGIRPLDARGRPRKREWEKPWVAAAGTVLALRGGFLGLGKLRQVIKEAPVTSKIGQIKEGFLSGDYSKKVPGLQKIGATYHGLKEEVKKLVYKPAAKPKYEVSRIDPKTGKMKSAKRLASEQATSEQKEEFRQIGAGQKHKLAFVPTTKPKEEVEWRARLREIRFAATYVPNYTLRDERGNSVRVHGPYSQIRRPKEPLPEWRRKDTQRHILEAAIIGTAGLGGLGIRAAGKRGFQLGREAEAAVAGPRLKTVLGYPFKVVEGPGVPHTPQKPVPFSARNHQEVRFGVRTLRTGLVAKWGRHLKTHIPSLEAGGRLEKAGTYSITDPRTKANIYVHRAKQRFVTGEKGWYKPTQKKWAYVSHIDLPKKHRATMEGGRSIHRIQETIFPHFDRRKIWTGIDASAYEGLDPVKRRAHTLGLVRGYQSKAGFKITSRGYTPSEWGVPMVRAPGARPGKKISEGEFTGYMNRIRRSSLKQSVSNLGKEFTPTVKDLAIVGGGGAVLAGTTAAAHKKGDSKVGTVAVPAAGVGAGAIGALYGPRLVRGIREVHERLPNIASHLQVASQQIGIGMGRKMAIGKSKLGRSIGRRLIGLA